MKGEVPIVLKKDIKERERGRKARRGLECNWKGEREWKIIVTLK